jgi:hypothetical protein
MVVATRIAISPPYRAGAALNDCSVGDMVWQAEAEIASRRSTTMELTGPRVAFNVARSPYLIALLRESNLRTE